jgi:hypothetical protein
MFEEFRELGQKKAGQFWMGAFRRRSAFAEASASAKASAFAKASADKDARTTALPKTSPLIGPGGFTDE